MIRVPQSVRQKDLDRCRPTAGSAHGVPSDLVVGPPPPPVRRLTRDHDVVRGLLRAEDAVPRVVRPATLPALHGAEASAGYPSLYGEMVDLPRTHPRGGAGPAAA